VFELELVAKSAEEFASADAQELATVKATGIPVAAVQEVVAAKSARRPTEVQGPLHETAEGPAEVSICQSQRQQPRRNRKMPEVSGLRDSTISKHDYESEGRAVEYRCNAR